MKQLILSFIVMITFTAAKAAETNPAVNEATMKNFTSLFGNISNVNWYTENAGYTAVFHRNEMKVVANFSKNGEFVSSIRYYKEDALPMHLQQKLTRRYKKMTVFGITEVTAGEATAYFVKMQDAKKWYTIKIDTAQNFEIIEDFKKS